MKVLIVDREPSNHSLTAQMLVKRGCQLLEVDGSEEGIQTARTQRPDIALVDLLTPKLDRGDFVRQLRRDPAMARMPVIFYTEGYLEIASGVARDIDALLAPILLCEEAIRGKLNGETHSSTASLREAGGTGEHGENGSKDLQDVFTFVSDSVGERAGIRPADLIGAAVDNARRTFPKSIEITSAYSQDLWLIEGDRPQLDRVVTNLILNARAAMPRGGSLLVWARNFNIDRRYASMTLGAKPGRYVMLRVSDTGHGTARPQVDDIISPFLDGLQIGPGTSLGLIKSHGGFMSVYSQFGKGTTFQIFLPAKAVAVCALPAVERTTEGSESYMLLSA